MKNTINRCAAWSVHLFTATGMVVGFIALEMAFGEKFYEAFLLLLLAAFIDGIDGTFARMFRVKEVLPDIDGHLIDGVVDCLNYVIVPAVIFHKSAMVPGFLSLPMVAGILYASMYHLANTRQVTDDYHFRGFPAWWNLVVYYLFILDLGQWPNLAITLLFIVLHFIPVHFIYLSRMRRNRTIAFAATLLLLIVNAMILLDYPQTGLYLKIASVIPLVFLLLLGSVKKELLTYNRYSENSI